VSGYFTAGSYERKGARRFIAERLIRLGIPLLVFDWILNPLAILPIVLIRSSSYARTTVKVAEGYYSSFHIGSGPLWFVETVLIFSAIYMIWRKIRGPVTIPEPADRGKVSHGQLLALAGILGAVSYLVRTWKPVGWCFEPMNLQLPFFPQYIAAFFLGTAAYRRGWMQGLSDDLGRVWLRVAIGLVALMAGMFITLGALKMDPNDFRGGWTWQSAFYSTWEQFTGVALSVGLLVWFRRKYNRQSPMAKAASDASYGAYVIHTPVIILIAVLLRGVSLHPLAKFVLLMAICVPVTFVLAHGLRKLPGVRKVL
ncbi:MAG: acyltransferase family protein, partial [Phycisphaerae bacterium]|nr:acyltransferase family protein [Phycisphaerae bacterium]